MTDLLLRAPSRRRCWMRDALFRSEKKSMLVKGLVTAVMAMAMAMAIAIAMVMVMVIMRVMAKAMVMVKVRVFE